MIHFFKSFAFLSLLSVSYLSADVCRGDINMCSGKAMVSEGGINRAKRSLNLRADTEILYNGTICEAGEQMLLEAKQLIKAEKAEFKAPKITFTSQVIELTESNISGNTYINGLCKTTSTNFDSDIFIDGNSITLDGQTIIKGNITFTQNTKGIVYASSNAVIQGQIINGKLITK